MGVLEFQTSITMSLLIHGKLEIWTSCSSSSNREIPSSGLSAVIGIAVRILTEYQIHFEQTC